MEIFDDLGFEEIVSTLLVIAVIVYFTYVRIKYLFRHSFFRTNRGVKKKKDKATHDKP